LTAEVVHIMMFLMLSEFFISFKEVMRWGINFL
jgi:hypothetical protein